MCQGTLKKGEKASGARLNNTSTIKRAYEVVTSKPSYCLKYKGVLSSYKLLRLIKKIKREKNQRNEKVPRHSKKGRKSLWCTIEQ